MVRSNSETIIVVFDNNFGLISKVFFYSICLFVDSAAVE